MKTQINDLENKINDLVVRINNAEENLTNTVTTEIKSVRDELQQLINQFELLKSQIQEENSDATITEDDIESMINLIDSYILDITIYNYYNDKKKYYVKQTFNNINIYINEFCYIEFMQNNEGYTNCCCYLKIFDNNNLFITPPNY